MQLNPNYMMRITRSRGGAVGFSKCLPVECQEALCPRPDASPGVGVCCRDTGRLELRAGWWFGGGHDLHVLGEDGLESLVSVDHGAKHQRLEGTGMLGH